MSEVKPEPEGKIQQQGRLPPYVSTTGKWRDAASMLESAGSIEITESLEAGSRYGPPLNKEYLESLRAKGVFRGKKTPSTSKSAKSK